MKKTIMTTCVLFFLLLFSVFFSLFFSFNDNFSIFFNFLNNSLSGNDLLILKIRLFRIITAFLIGGLLSVSGMIFQAITRNPLAEPYLLGTSSGAGLGLCIGIYFGIIKVLGYWSLMMFSFSGAVISIFLVFSLSYFKGRSDPLRLILSGVIVGSIFSAVMVFLLSISKTSEFHGIMGWFLGDLEVFRIDLILILSVLSLIVYLLILPTIKYLDVMSLGDTSSLSLGIDINKIRSLYFVLISVLVGGAVSLTGIIGFIGLIIPHIFRRILGPKHKPLFFFCIFGGGIFLIVCELISRLVIPGVIIPIGVITALVGGPYFLTLLRKGR
ncbi:MAG: iron ABC transporter permease [bacterium]|nr:iron ABC transporter permease [bacterium]